MLCPLCSRIYVKKQDPQSNCLDLNRPDSTGMGCSLVSCRVWGPKVGRPAGSLDLQLGFCKVFDIFVLEQGFSMVPASIVELSNGKKGTLIVLGTLLHQALLKLILHQNGGKPSSPKPFKPTLNPKPLTP